MNFSIDNAIANSTPNTWIIYLLPTILLVVGLIALFLFLTRWLWNTTLPHITGCREITLWQTAKILLLSAILFGGMRLPFGYSRSQTADRATTTWTIGHVTK